MGSWAGPPQELRGGFRSGRCPGPRSGVAEVRAASHRHHHRVQVREGGAEGKIQVPSLTIAFIRRWELIRIVSQRPASAGRVR